MAEGRSLRRAIAGACAFLAAAATPAPAQQQSAPAWRTLHEEIEIAGMLGRLAGEDRPAFAVLRNVRVVDPVERTILDRQSILISVEQGTILGVVGTDNEPAAASRPGVLVIDGGGAFAAPGLADMHIHSDSVSANLLNLANGVTTVREMDGFAWLLSVREAIASRRMLGPTTYVAGTIINGMPLDGYAVVARDALSARRIVRQQAACGYDFIKIHNVLPPSVFDAVADEARRAGLDLVGHVPHRIGVRHAAESGMRTMEHLKGWLDDRTLQIGDTDYAVAARESLWVTPTFYAYRRHADPSALDAMLRARASAYVPARVRAQWREAASAERDALFTLNQDALPLRHEIVRALVANQARFLAGSDAAGYPLHTMGFALIEELRLMREAGIPDEQVLRAATSEAAAALRAEGAFGRIAPGARADIVLLDRNPLDDPLAYAHNRGVIARGLWLERAAIDAALAALAALYADDAPRPPSEARLVERAEQTVASGFVFNPSILRDAASAARADGESALAERLLRLAVAPETPPCGAETP
ncbi:MAG: amidohydrolase family protein [Hyphomonadaceae bacterium]